MSTPRETQQFLSLAALSVMSNLREISREGLESVAKQAVITLPGQVSAVKNILCSMGEDVMAASIAAPTNQVVEESRVTPGAVATSSLCPRRP